jgi:hypothetical protein
MSGVEIAAAVIGLVYGTFSASDLVNKYTNEAGEDRGRFDALNRKANRNYALGLAIHRDVLIIKDDGRADSGYGGAYCHPHTQLGSRRAKCMEELCDPRVRPVSQCVSQKGPQLFQPNCEATKSGSRQATSASAVISAGCHSHPEALSMSYKAKSTVEHPLDIALHGLSQGLNSALTMACLLLEHNTSTHKSNSVRLGYRTKSTKINKINKINKWALIPVSLSVDLA